MVIEFAEILQDLELKRSAARAELPPHLASTPKIVNTTIEGSDWSELGEMAVEA